MHLVDATDEMSQGELYTVTLGDLNADGTSYGVRINASLGHRGDYDVEQAIVEGCFKR